MIKSWKHKGLRRFFETGSTAGIQSAHQERIKIILQRLNAAIRPEDMNTPGMAFHPLKGNLKGYFAVTVRSNWRIIFKFEGEDAILVNYLDYH
jgi:proteic killer suppression protein